MYTQSQPSINRPLAKVKNDLIMYNHITILHQNINGIINKSDLFSVHLQELMDSGKKIDVICYLCHRAQHADRR
jgi:hypothetical protein